jgi:hypothetical protein
MMATPKSYVLKNISKYDISLSDLGVRIPLGQSKDLLSSAVNLKWEDVYKSKMSGSIGLRLKKGMVMEVCGVVGKPKPPTRVDIIREAVMVKFPDRVNSLLVIDVGNISEEIEKMSINEDDELLKQLDIDAMMEGNGSLLITGDDEKKD